MTFTIPKGGPLLLGSVLFFSPLGCGKESKDSQATSATAFDFKAAMPDFFDPESAFAESGIGVSRGPTGTLYLRASNCDKVSKAVAALAALRKRTDGIEGVGAVPVPSLRPSGWCEVKLDTLLPSLVANTFGKRIDDTSLQVNCWSHAVSATGVLPGMLAASADFFTYTMNSPQCKEVPANEALQVGDIVTYRGLEKDSKPGEFKFEEAHAVVFVTEDLSISKDGAGEYTMKHPSILTKQWMRITGETKKACAERADRNAPASQLADCSLLVQAFRCQTRAEYIASQSSLPKVFLSLLPRLEAANWSLALEAIMVEGKSEVVPAGAAFISRKPFDLAAQLALEAEDVPAGLKKAIATTHANPYDRNEIDFDRPTLPTWPSDVAASIAKASKEERDSMSGDAFVAVQTYLTSELNGIARALSKDGASLSDADTHLLRMQGFYLRSSDKVFENDFDALDIKQSRKFQAK